MAAMIFQLIDVQSEIYETGIMLKTAMKALPDDVLTDSVCLIYTSDKKLIDLLSS